MSEESSSNDEWDEFTKRQVCHVQRLSKCWECGKKFRNITSLMSHYKNHNIKATCHICKVTFRRLTSLSTHLDNVHSPPLCKKCHHSFSNVWELNKHVEAHCMGSGLNSCANEVAAQQRTDSVSEVRHRERLEMRPETSENSVEYIVGEDDKDIDMESLHQTDDETSDDSTSSNTDNEDEVCAKTADMSPVDAESDAGSNSSSTDFSSDSSNTPPKETPKKTLPGTISFCTACGRGPFRSLKLHTLHCTGIKVKYQCSRCKALFPNETSLKEHYIPLYSCDICGLVFSHGNSYHRHECPKGSNSPLVYFCSESMPKACNICKAFFTSEKTLLNHVTRVHTSVVSTKLCIITNPSALTDIQVSPIVSGTAAQLATSSSGHVLVSSNNVCQNPNAVKQVINGNYAGCPSTVMKVSPSVLTTSPMHAGRPPTSTCSATVATPVKLGKDAAIGQPTDQSPHSLSAPSPLSPVATEKTQPHSPPVPTIIAMFENDSKEVALMKRMNTGWRSKAPYPCRQCGAIFRQPSLVISHRYLHRGPRSHLCQCGRAFKHRLHLLRHCVQHAEAISYICVNCGENFTGARLLAEHVKGKPRKESRSSGRTWKHRVKRKCRMPFTCDCGQLFFRPSAYIWHQLKNKMETKRLTKTK